MRTATFFTIGVFLSIALSANADGLLSIESTTGPAGGEAVVNIKQEGAKATGALDMEISFAPDAMEFVKAEPGDVADNAQVQANQVTPGQVKVALMDLDGLSGDGTVIALHFKVKAAVGTKVPIKIVSAQANHYEALVEIPVKLEDGEVEVIEASASESSGEGLSPGMLKIVIGAAAGVVVIIILIVLVSRGKNKQAS
jgi:hypothetical protein